MGLGQKSSGDLITLPLPINPHQASKDRFPVGLRPQELPEMNRPHRNRQPVEWKSGILRRQGRSYKWSWANFDSHNWKINSTWKLRIQNIFCDNQDFLRPRCVFEVAEDSNGLTPTPTI